MPILLKEDLERPLPPMYWVRQQFNSEELTDVVGAVKEQLARPEVAGLVKPGARIAVAVGSRGIRDLFPVVHTTIECLKALGAKPFIVSAMGSHGGGTEEGQREVLTGYGITEENLGVPVVTTVDTVLLGHAANGRPIWFDRAAFEADLVVPINRVKLHTDFVGPLQSGLCKMLVIGLGNHKGCSAAHEEDSDHFAAMLEETAGIILEKAPIGFGVAILENAYDKTRRIEAVPAKGWIEREKELVQEAKANMPCIMLPEADVIVCQELGSKNLCPAYPQVSASGAQQRHRRQPRKRHRRGTVRRDHQAGGREPGPGSYVRQRHRLQLPGGRQHPLYGGGRGHGHPGGTEVLSGH